MKMNFAGHFDFHLGLVHCGNREKNLSWHNCSLARLATRDFAVQAAIGPDSKIHADHWVLVLGPTSMKAHRVDQELKLHQTHGKFRVSLSGEFVGETKEAC